MDNIRDDAGDLVKEYFKQYGGFTCSWSNVKKILVDRLTVEKYLMDRIEELENELKK